MRILPGLGFYLNIIFRWNWISTYGMSISTSQPPSSDLRTSALSASSTAASLTHLHPSPQPQRAMALPPRTLRPLSRIRIGIPSFRATRSYQSSEHPAPSLYPPIESAILSSALSHVPSHGFTPLALRLGARDAGYLDVSTNLFPRGVFELVHFHLVTRRLALKDEVQFPVDGKEISGSGKVRTLLLGRLMANEKARVVQRWPEVRSLCLSSTSRVCFGNISLRGHFETT